MAKKKDENPYALFNYEDENATTAEKKMSKKVTVQITKILKQASKFPNVNLVEQAEKIKMLGICNVGIGDTATDENIAAVFGEMLNATGKCACSCNDIEELFYDLIHR